RLSCVRPCRAVSLRDVASFPTRRSSDLRGRGRKCAGARVTDVLRDGVERGLQLRRGLVVPPEEIELPVVLVQLQRVHRLALADGDRKSTRLNSSHVKISYAVFCLKKKKT